MDLHSNVDILKEMENVWNMVDEIEKGAKEVLNADNPILVSLGFAWVHIMNTCDEIEKNIHRRGCNKFKPKTLAQILDILSRIKFSGATGRIGLINAYQKAVQEVGKFNIIHRNTPADACTRRLQIKRDGFLKLVEDWLLVGKPKNLVLILKSHCDVALHGRIDDFFDAGARGPYICQ